VLAFMRIHPFDFERSSCMQIAAFRQRQRGLASKSDRLRCRGRLVRNKLRRGLRSTNANAAAVHLTSAAFEDPCSLTMSALPSTSCTAPSHCRAARHAVDPSQTAASSRQSPHTP
jgi:hypothetical protein